MQHRIRDIIEELAKHTLRHMRHEGDGGARTGSGRIDKAGAVPDFKILAAGFGCRP
ncbi:MAG: hypothetical protein AAFX05_14150 [Planctomycetota bacterium]